MKQENYNNYKVGALKRKFKLGPENREPGTFIQKANENKPVVEKSADVSTMKPATRTAFMGMV